MSKILVAINATVPDMNAVDFACYLAKLKKTKLTAVLLENLEYEEIFVKREMDDMPYDDTILSTALPENALIRERCEESITRFKAACDERETKYIIHRQRSSPMDELKQESRFADLLVVDAGLSFREGDDGEPSDFVKDLLAEAECPVVIAPESFITPEEVVFAYNGNKSSVYALRQFTYLFPEMRDMKLTVVEVNDENGVVTEKYKLKEWLKEYYTDFDFQVLEGNAKEALFQCLLNKPNAIAVMGSYGRSAVSNIFKPSVANKVLKFITRPLFIAHP